MILTIGPGGCGFSFLNWSISYLRGDSYYCNLSKEQVPVEINPLQGSTAHNFQRDHIQATEDLSKLDHATDQTIVYVVPTHQADLEKIFAVDCKKLVFQTNPLTNEEFFSRIYFTLPSNQDLTMNKKSARNFVENFDPVYDKNVVKQVLLECNRFFIEYYQIPKQYTDYLNVTYNDIFVGLDKKIHEIFNFLNLTIDHARWGKWLTIYREYQEKNQNFKSQFVQLTFIDSKTKLHILKEIINWTNGLCLRVN